MKRTSLVAVAVACLIGLAGSDVTHAQSDKATGQGKSGEKARGKNKDGDAKSRRTGGMSEKQARSAWKLEAQTVARALDLEVVERQKLIKAYEDARRAFADAIDGRREDLVSSGTDKAANAGQRRERIAQGLPPGGGMMVQHREKMAASFGAFLNDEQVARALQSMGTFNTNWDRMVIAVKRLDLDEDTQAEVLDYVETFVTTTSQVGKPDRSRVERMAEREQAMASLRGALDPLLDDKQMSKLKKALPKGKNASMSDRLPSLDANDDGKLQKSEVPERMHARFDKWDTNGDGVLDAGEMEKVKR